MSNNTLTAIVVIGLLAFLFGLGVLEDQPAGDCCTRADSLEAELRWIAVQDSVRAARDRKRTEEILGAPSWNRSREVGPRIEEE